MNYRHEFHAGNFADVVKHALLARVLAYLVRKDNALRFIDTHAGAGRYDLASRAAERSPEWRDGVGRLLKAKPPAEVATLLEPYLAALGPIDAAEGRPLSYPGSPAIAQALLRPQDRIALCESNPEEREKLIVALGHDSRLNIAPTDGYVALNAYVPPKERRGLALIDPPYEATDEAERVRQALEKALGKWPNGIFMLWRPIKDDRADRRFLRALADLEAPNMLRIEIDVGAIPPGLHSLNPLRRIGLLFVNPPFPLYDEALILMPYLGKLLTRAAGSGIVCEWLTPPM